MPNNNSICVHCGSNCNATPIISGNNHFCCSGCLQVYTLLNQHKLYQYYNLSQQPGIKVENPAYQNKYVYLDNNEIKTKLYQFLDNSIAKVQFYIPTIHCISCIWLLEHLNKLNAGILQSTVNFVNKTVTITFNTSQISLRQLVELLVSINYIPQINLQNLNNQIIPKSNKTLLYKIGVAGFIFGNVMLYSLPQYFNGKPITDGLSLFLNYLSLLLTIPLLVYCGSDYFVSSYKALRNRLINIDLPIALGLLALFIVTCFEIISQTGQGYCDSISGLLFFLLLGKWYQNKTYQALMFNRDYKSYFPIAVTKIIDSNELTILLEEINENDLLLIRNRELIPADSVLVSGTALIDYSFVTGESVPVLKTEGEFLYAGGMQTQGAIVVKVISQVKQSHLTSLWNESNLNKVNSTPLISVIDKISVYFTFIIVFIAIAGFSWWLYMGNIHTAILVFTAVLIVTCPCALALALPFTFGNAMQMLGLKGMYIKNTQVIEQLSKVNTIVFDKTGTLTIPDQSNVEFIGEPLSKNETELVVSVIKQSAHPLSIAIAKHYAHVKTLPTQTFVETAGQGICARVNNNEVKIGSLAYVSTLQNATNTNKGGVYIVINNQLKGYFKIGNKYRPGIEKVLTTLRNKFKLYLLSGDNNNEQAYLSEFFNTGAMYFNQQPQQKNNFVIELRDTGHNVLMTGDGLNDAGAFMQSNVAISVADNVYHFSPAAHAIIEASQFYKLNLFIAYTHKTVRVVKVSFVISFIYNIIGLYFALSGTLMPVVAAILMPVSSVSVVAFATLATRWLARKL